MTRRTVNLQAFLDAFAREHKIMPDFIAASDHAYDCRCDKCKEWWRKIGADPDTEDYGPFTKEEIENDD